MADMNALIKLLNQDNVPYQQNSRVLECEWLKCLIEFTDFSTFGIGHIHVGAIKGSHSGYMNIYRNANGFGDTEGFGNTEGSKPRTNAYCVNLLWDAPPLGFMIPDHWLEAYFQLGTPYPSPVGSDPVIAAARAVVEAWQENKPMAGLITALEALIKTP